MAKKTICMAAAIMCAATATAVTEPDVAADTSQVRSLDEVVVVAQPKEGRPLRRQPLSSTVVAAADMNALGITDMSGLAFYVPSTAVPAYGSRLTSAAYIRGIGSRVDSPAIGVYVDGVPIVSKSAFNMHIYQAERADILRGPQGTLYGMNAEGGLIRIYTKDPLLHRGTHIRMGLGTQFQRDIEAAHYGKAWSGAGFAIAGFYSGSNGFYKNQTTGTKADNYDEGGGRARLTARLNNRLTADIGADYQYVRQNAFPYGLLNTDDNTTSSPSGNRQNSYKRNMLNTWLTMRYNGDGLQLTSTTSWQMLSDHMTMDQDYTAADLMHLEQRQLINSITQEVSMRGTASPTWHHATGLYGSYQWLHTDAPVYFDPDFTGRISGGIQTAMYSAMLKAMTDRLTAGGMDPAQAAIAAAQAIERGGGISVDTHMSVPAAFKTPQANIGIFHESDINITDKLSATLGLRCDMSHVRVDYATSALMAVSANVMGQNATNTLTSALVGGASDNYVQLLPKIGLSLIADSRGSNVYATVSKGYRAGGYNIQMFSDILQHELNENSDKAMTGSYDIPHTPDDYNDINSAISYKPEESWNYEMGAHLNLPGGRVHADMSIYYMQIRNQQLSVMAGEYGFGRMMVNAGKSVSWGLEASLRGSAIDNRLSWAATYGLTNATFREYSETTENGDVINYKGKRVPFIPMHTASARADLMVYSGNRTVNAVVIGADVTAQGRIYWDEANTYSQPFYALLGAHADIRMSGVNLRLWCKNITGTHYNTFAFDSSASGQTLHLAQSGAPIHAGIDVSLHF